jgi:hypothetical protein
VWDELIGGGKPAAMAAAFGYAVESLVSIEESPYAIKVPAEYALFPQFVSGGTRPDLIIRLQKGDEDIAWVDITASKSTDHIFQKEAWGKKVDVFAEVTYPSLDDATWQLMQQNKDNKSPIDPDEFEKKKEAARKRREALKAHWKKIGGKFSIKALTDELKKEGLDKEIRGLQPERARKFITGKLKTAFGAAPREEMVPSILAALQVGSVSWGFSVGYNENLRAGEIWLEANDKSIPSVAEEKNLLAEEEVGNVSPMDVDAEKEGEKEGMLIG